MTSNEQATGAPKDANEPKNPVTARQSPRCRPAKSAKTETNPGTPIPSPDSANKQDRTVAREPNPNRTSNWEGWVPRRRENQTNPSGARTCSSSSALPSGGQRCAGRLRSKGPRKPNEPGTGNSSSPRSACTLSTETDNDGRHRFDVLLSGQVQGNRPRGYLLSHEPFAVLSVQIKEKLLCPSATIYSN